MAQAPDAPADSGDIIVTATKRSESLQTVPISIQALGSDTLKQHQVTSFDDYARLLPSVSYQSFGPSQSQLYFRGITSGGDGLASGPLPTAGLYIDETPVTTIYGSLDLHAYDLARVEALAGPQGTLYGASSLSGTLRLITNKPEIGKFSAGYDIGGNKFGKGAFGGSFEGFINIPINDMMALRVVGYYQHDGGYVDNIPGSRTYRRTHADGAGGYVDSPLTVNNNRYAEKDYNDVDSYGGRAALAVDLDDNWTITPAVIYQRQIAHGQFLFDPRAGDLQNHDFTPNRNQDEWYLASMTIQGKLSDWDVTYSGSYFERWVDNVTDYSYFSVAYDNLATDSPNDYANYTYLKDALGNDIDPTQTIHGNDKYSKMSHELRVSSPSDKRLRLTAGMFWQRQTDRRIADYIVPGVANAVDPFSPPVPGAPADDVFYTNLYRIDRDYAMFGEASFDILPAVTLSAGIRGFMAHNTLQGFSGGASTVTRQAGIDNCTVVTAQGCPNVNKSYQEVGETHRVGLKWQIDRTRMVYATYSTGFRPGGNNRDAFFNGNVVSNPPYVSDTLTNYEVGFKTAWFDRKLRLNAAFFLEDWDNVQYSLPGILGIFYTVNAGVARSKGVEGDISWTAARGLTFSASGTYVEPKLRTSFCDTQNGCDPANGGALFAPAGTRLPITPRFKINGNARYETNFGAYEGFLQGSVNHQSGTTSYLTTAGEAVLGPTDAFTTFDFSAGISKGNTSLTAFIVNAFDERGILSKNISCAPSLCGQYARLYPTKPQQFGIKFGQRF
ncbi:MAG TPA: TonB-dependent receptor [Sphingobium sp.]